ncbi:MAG: hypothetical protein RIQ71_1549 [Verrucomicrobiota bacterium]|jgi:hypothetical protein
MNRAQREQSAGVGPLACWLAVVLFIGFLGLCYVQMKQKLAAEGNICRELENSVKGLDEKLHVLNTDIRRLTGRPSLERRKEEGFIRMIEVTDSRIVRVRKGTDNAALSPGIAEVVP